MSALLLPFLLSAATWAGDRETARREVDSLLSGLVRSGCSFQRNGTWYAAAKAAEHLSVKRRYLESHGGVRSAEQFIDEAASRSSLTGRPYLVRCPDRPEQPSRDWLTDRLKAMRGR